ncbi:uncharacterized protein LOC135695580 [Rhopilema esculentum]|uniref:uncharacterized protein LOC135695580 n=1 Tax=Rhopilema esculentum TaxID=499914 RepID=UPI0031CE5C28
MFDGKGTGFGLGLSCSYFILFCLLAYTVYLHERVSHFETKIAMMEKPRDSEFKDDLARIWLQLHAEISRKCAFRMKMMDQVVQSRAKREAPNLASNGDLGGCQNATLVCQKGEKGAAGEPGPQGMKGNVGAKGDLGIIGPSGVRGPPGLQGTKGDRGWRGNPGPQGTRGDRGWRGNPGPQGTKGDRGWRGNPGAQGTKGGFGTKGERGASGSVGPTGPEGQKGQKGDRGEPGKSPEVPLIVTMFPKVTRKMEMTNLTLNCTATGFPEPKIIWQFERQKERTRYTLPTSNILQIIFLKDEDSGNIRCMANNSLGTAIASTRLTVQTKPKVALLGNFSRYVGTPAEIDCNVTGIPTPTITWTKRFGQMLGQQSLSADGTRLTLRIGRPTTKDSGEYICEARNSVGVTEKSIAVSFYDYATDCSELRQLGHTATGIYTIKPDSGSPFPVFCDMTKSGGGWTVIQRRTDGSVDFYRGWNDYKNGFGVLDNELWLGNDKIHRLTQRTSMKIRFDLEAKDGDKAFAEYSSFRIEGEQNQYKLHVSGYSGTAGDSFTYHDKMMFSTFDRNSYSCAQTYRGAWWYYSCHNANLNGRYLNGPHSSYADGINWYLFKGHHDSLVKTTMKIKVNF